MSSFKEDACWLLVKWGDGTQEVIYVQSVLSTLRELQIGEVLTANRGGKAFAATLLARSHDKDKLEARMKNKADSGPSAENEDDPKDYSASDSSWNLSNESETISGDSDQPFIKMIKLKPCKRHYSNRRARQNVLTPVHRTNAVLRKCTLKISNVNKEQKATQYDTPVYKLLDSTKINTPKISASNNIRVILREFADIRDSFHNIFQIIYELKQLYSLNANQSVMDETLKTLSSIEKTSNNISNIEEQEVENNESDFDRSDDNVLITNKYDNSNTSRRTEIMAPQKEKSEWIPIGSGQTKIHAEKYKNIKWKSFTVATRSLLTALFPRRVLATHSLTGKRSPAFQDKPAKMCLNPKIISDIIMEVTDRFNVKENLVRSIITTKCADESKMLKTRIMKKKSAKNQENVPPTKSGHQ